MLPRDRSPRRLVPARRFTRLLPALAVTAGLLVPMPVGAQSLRDARTERAAVQERLDAAALDLAEVQARIGTLTDQETALAREVAVLEDQIAEADERIGERVRDLYKRGVDTPVLQLLSGADATEAIERAELAHHLLSGDHVLIEETAAARRRATQVEDQLAQRRAELDGAVSRQQSVLAALQDDLERARELEARLEAEERARIEAERRAAEQAAAAAAEQPAVEQAAPPPPPPASSGGTACPVGNPRSYTDTWGAPRSGGRSHQGTDILAPHGVPIYAVVSGVWDIRSYGSSAGYWAMLRGDNGTTYYYMHLQSHTVGDGARVSAGQQTGANGDTGNARGTPHLHFEVHPGGGGAVNPYPTVLAACG